MGFGVKLGIASFLERLEGERISIAKKLYEVIYHMN
jgi:hypothetical protein